MGGRFDESIKSLVRRKSILTMTPGEIYWANLTSGRRPVVVVSREAFNRGMYIQIIPFTSKHFEKRSKLRNCVPFRHGECGLPMDCVAQCEMLAAVEKSELDASAPLLGTLDELKSREIIRALGYVFCAECEPE